MNVIKVDSIASQGLGNDLALNFDYHQGVIDNSITPC